MNHYECGNLFQASKRLLEGSGLVRYSNDTLVCNSDEEGLEKCWRENFDQDFGRYMAWVWFSVGAENLVKAALVCSGLLEQKQENSRYPFYWPRHGQRGMGRPGSAIPARTRGRVSDPRAYLGKEARRIVPRARDRRSRM